MGGEVHGEGYPLTIQEHYLRSLEAENEKLREALQKLVDEQNGPPLLSREQQWNEAMNLAAKLLGGGGE